MQNLVPPGGSEGESVPYLSPEKSPLHCTAILGPEAASSLKGHVHEMLQTGGAPVSSKHCTQPCRLPATISHNVHAVLGVVSQQTLHL